MAPLLIAGPAATGRAFSDIRTAPHYLHALDQANERKLAVEGEIAALCRNGLSVPCLKRCKQLYRRVSCLQDVRGRGLYADLFPYAFKATSTRSGKSGEWRTRAPVRAATALLTAGPTRGVAICPAPVG